jgi:hypothetical protein
MPAINIAGLSLPLKPQKEIVKGNRYTTNHLNNLVMGCSRPDNGPDPLRDRRLG